MKNKENQLTLKRIALIGVMAAAVFVASRFLQIPIPTPIDKTRLHMGNVFCLLSGLLLGPIQGGFAAGIGSAFFDLTDPAYITSAPFTFAFKFLMGWLCGMLVRCRIKNRTAKYAIAAASGSFAYVLLYLAKSFIEHRFVVGLPLDAVLLTISEKGIISSVNAVISTIVVVPLGLALRPAIQRMSL